MRRISISYFSLASQDAIRAPPETLLYLPAIVTDGSRPDYLVTVDVDPKSADYQKVNRAEAFFFCPGSFSISPDT